MKDITAAALAYHSEGKAGKITVIPSKPCDTGDDLSLAYTPGVAKPCLEINKNIEDAWKYTSKGNLVAVVSDGTAVLGLGNIGPEAGLPVMEGKAVLFKHFADIDSIPLCIGKVFTESGRTDAAKVIETVERLEPTFGGINLEDIGAPACFEIEAELKKRMNIPVFHDDQHGTAIISMAAIINALKLVNKKIEECKFVVNGAGAAGIACSRFYLTCGAKKENFTMCDSKGVIHTGRSDLNEQKKFFARDTDARTLADAMKGADIFLGFSAPECVTADMVKTMAPGAIIFAMANPDPEIAPAEVAKALEGRRFIMVTGRSDYPNQINNVLGFPYLFRGALDVRARTINKEMKVAAANALAMLARQPVPEEVKSIYPDENLEFGDGYIIPKPFDRRLFVEVSYAVAEAAVKTGVAAEGIDLAAYRQSLESRNMSR